MMQNTGKMLLAVIFVTLSMSRPSSGQDPAIVSVFVDKGMAEIGAGRLSEALAVFDKCLNDVKPAPWQCRFRRGIVLSAIPARRAEAPAELEIVAKGHPTEMPVFYALGRAYSLLSDHQRAVDAFTRALQLDPGFRNAWVSRANAYFYNRQLDNAIKDITEAIRIDPKDAKAFDLRGTFHMYSLDHARAIPDLNRAIELDPSFVMPYITRGNSFALQGKFLEAVADHTKAISLDPTSLIAFKSRAAAYCSMGKKDLAVSDEKKVLELGGKVEQPCKY
jgi:tetratricopeptide (TPR) repeat protein